MDAPVLAETDALTKPRRKKDAKRSGSLGSDAQRKTRQAVKRDTTEAGSSSLPVCSRQFQHDGSYSQICMLVLDIAEACLDLCK